MRCPSKVYFIFCILHTVSMKYIYIVDLDNTCYFFPHIGTSDTQQLRHPLTSPSPVTPPLHSTPASHKQVVPRLQTSILYKHESTLPHLHPPLLPFSLHSQSAPSAHARIATVCYSVCTYCAIRDPMPPIGYALETFSLACTV